MTSETLTDAPLLTEAIPIRCSSQNCNHTATSHRDMMSYGTASTTLTRC